QALAPQSVRAARAALPAGGPAGALGPRRPRHTSCPPGKPSQAVPCGRAAFVHELGSGHLVPRTAHEELRQYRSRAREEVNQMQAGEGVIARGRRQQSGVSTAGECPTFDDQEAGDAFGIQENKSSLFLKISLDNILR